MTDEVKRVVETLRYCEETGARCNECPSGMNEQGVSNCPKQSDIADLIEVLAATLKQIAQERDGLNIMLGQAQSMLETRTRERDAAIEDMQKSALYLCQVCRKYHSAVKGVNEHFCEQLGQRIDFCGAIACSMFEWRGVQEG